MGKPCASSHACAKGARDAPKTRIFFTEKKGFQIPAFVALSAELPSPQVQRHLRIWKRGNKDRGRGTLKSPHHKTTSTKPATWKSKSHMRTGVCLSLGKGGVHRSSCPEGPPLPRAPWPGRSGPKDLLTRLRATRISKGGRSCRPTGGRGLECPETVRWSRGWSSLAFPETL